ncbi:MAG: hypothetical protein IMZ64_03035 [Bacteroidetes bacterium]|nr:hypothetical protein [Bacteroidota bacterium]
MAKIKDFLMNHFLMLLIAAVIGTALFLASYFWPSYDRDNIIEQSVEQVIKNTIGLEIDITPEA